MTHGAFYSHFASKEDLASAAIQEAIEQSNTTLDQALADPIAPKEAYLDAYLSPEHRDRAQEGCPLAALAIEIGRRKTDTPLLADHVKALLRRVVAGFRWSVRGSERDQAILMTSAMVGAIILSRAVGDPDLSDEILAATRRQLAAR